MNEVRSGKNPISSGGANRRINVWYGVLVIVFIVTLGRLFYLQVVRYDHYHQAALADQLKKYAIPAQRGVIQAHQGDLIEPLVLNQKLYTVYADPSFIKDASGESKKVAAVLGGDASRYNKLMKVKDSRYQILAKRVGESVNQRLLGLKLPGVDSQAQDYRTYPQGSLASQLLGFVNDAGIGTYGIEQVFDSKLRGQPGELKAITDANGVPLAANRANVRIAPKNGDNITLGIDLNMQAQVEKLLKDGLNNVHSGSGSVMIMDPNTGQIKAMANWPTYDPSQYFNVKDLRVFNNAVVSAPYEVGSIMKTLTISTGINEHTITKNSTYHDSGSVKIDGHTITNINSVPPDQTSIFDILRLSLNTGAVHVLSTLGGGEINQRARQTWYNYMTKHFMLGKLTGIEQPGEQSGVIPDPLNGYGLNIQYANTAFGQGMTATMIQMASAFSSAINGGNYYKPHLVESYQTANGSVKEVAPQIIEKNVVAASTSADLRQLLKNVFEANHVLYTATVHPGYSIGGKTGTAQIADPAGGYYANRFDGSYLGYVGGDKPQYVVIVRVNEPQLPTFESAGTQGAAPIFGKIADMLINSGNVTPISK